MTREIKFRVWDNLSGVMSEEFCVFGEFTLMGGVHNWQEEVSNLKGNSIERLGDLVLMQFTGLKDKNRKEIYEGDILKDHLGYKWIVSWNMDHACFQVNCDNVVAEIIDNQNMEVFGNICEVVQ